jgi:hypothetical protein
MHTTRLSLLTASSQLLGAELLGAVLVATVLLLGACAPASSDPELYLSADKSVFDGRVDHVVLRVQAFTRTGAMGQGVVSFVAPAGAFAEAADVTLVDGFGTVSFTCNPEKETACSGTMRLGATWEGQSANVQVRVTPSTRETALSWRVVPTNSLATLVALAVAPDNTVYAVGSGGTVLRLIDSQWTNVSSPTTENLTGVAVTPRGVPVIVGEHGTLLVGRSGRLELVSTSLEEEDFTSVSATSETAIDVGSTSGTIFHFDGSSMATAFSLGAPVLSLARNGAATWAGGEGIFGVNDGASWELSAAPVLARFTVALPSAGKLWVAGARMDNGGGVLMEGPETWHAVTLDEPITALAIVPKGDERFAITSTGVYRQIGEGSWLRAVAPMGGRAAVSRFSNDLVVVGPPGISMFRN